MIELPLVTDRQTDTGTHHIDLLGSAESTGLDNAGLNSTRLDNKRPDNDGRVFAGCVLLHASFFQGFPGRQAGEIPKRENLRVSMEVRTTDWQSQTVGILVF